MGNTTPKNHLPLTVQLKIFKLNTKGKLCYGHYSLVSGSVTNSVHSELVSRSSRQLTRSSRSSDHPYSLPATCCCWIIFIVSIQLHSVWVSTQFCDWMGVDSAFTSWIGDTLLFLPPSTKERHVNPVPEGLVEVKENSYVDNFSFPKTRGLRTISMGRIEPYSIRNLFRLLANLFVWTGEEGKELEWTEFMYKEWKSESTWVAVAYRNPDVTHCFVKMYTSA